MSDIKLDGEVNFTEWGWGSPPPQVQNFHEQSCVIGARTVINAFLDEGSIGAQGIDDAGVLVYFTCGADFGFVANVNLVEPFSEWDEEEAMNAVKILRRWADAIEAKANA